MQIEIKSSLDFVTSTEVMFRGKAATVIVASILAQVTRGDGEDGNVTISLGRTILIENKN